MKKLRYPKTSHQPGKRCAFSLVEVMVALFVFSLLALGVTAGVIQSLRLSDKSISRAMAHSIAVGYAEQIMATDYFPLLSNLTNGTPFVLYSIPLNSTGLESETEDIFTFGVEREKTIVMDVEVDNPTVASKNMQMKFTFTATNLNQGSKPYEALEVKISYAYLPSASRSSDESAWLKDEVHMVKSSVLVY